MTSQIFVLLGVNIAVVVSLALAMWGLAVKGGDPSFIDACWGFGFPIVAWVSLAVTATNTDGGSPTRSLLLVGCSTVWGVRLGGYLLWRWRKNGPDKRYQAMLRHTDNPKMFMLKKVFLLQAALLLLVSLPLQLGQVYPKPAGIGLAQIIGLVLVVFGVAFESLADLQLVRFKADPANEGSIMDRGLWRYTRHPNYFGDLCTWWGLFAIGFTNPVSIITLASPLVMSFLLMKWSGVGPLERQMKRRKPGYEGYIARTSGFFPMPPRRAIGASTPTA